MLPPCLSSSSRNKTRRSRGKTLTPTPPTHRKGEYKEEEEEIYEEVEKDLGFESFNLHCASLWDRCYLSSSEVDKVCCLLASFLIPFVPPEVQYGL